MMLTSDVPYSDPSHNHNAPDHGMQTHHSLYTKQLFNQMLAMKNRSAAAMLCGGRALAVMSLNQLFEIWH